MPEQNQPLNSSDSGKYLFDLVCQQAQGKLRTLADSAENPSTSYRGEYSVKLSEEQARLRSTSESVRSNSGKPKYEKVIVAGEPLLVAAYLGDLTICKILIQSFNAVVTSPDTETGNTALHLAAKEGYTDVVEYLINNEHALDRKNNKGETPLYLAVYWGHAEITHLLIQVGKQKLAPGGKVSDKYIHDDKKQNILHVAAESPHSGNLLNALWESKDHGKLIVYCRGKSLCFQYFAANPPVNSPFFLSEKARILKFVKPFDQQTRLQRQHSVNAVSAQYQFLALSNFGHARRGFHHQK